MIRFGTKIVCVASISSQWWEQSCCGRRANMSERGELVVGGAGAPKPHALSVTSYAANEEQVPDPLTFTVPSNWVVDYLCSRATHAAGSEAAGYG